MTKTWFAVSALALTLGATSGGIAAKAYATPAPAQPQYAQPQYEGQDGQGRWDEPPSEYRDASRAGFHDGIEAARRDYSERRHKDADDHEMYRHPPVEHSLRDDYRRAFREGYSRAMNHMRADRRDRDDDDHRR